MFGWIAQAPFVHKLQKRSGRLSCGTIALIAVLVAFLWQLVTVTRNYRGDWTALYCIGGVMPTPPELQGAYRFEGSRGFDGQFYLIIAMDPLLRRGMDRYVDEPDLRYRRILVPAVAYLLGFGQPAAIVYSYLLVNLGFLFLGTWWMSRHAVLCSLHPARGWLFLLVPGVLISLDRQTVDMALTALCLGAAYAWRSKQHRLLLVFLPLICLVRETGVLIAGAFVLAFLIRRERRKAAIGVACVAPFFAWSWWVAARVPLTLREWLPERPYAWTIDALLHPAALPFSPAVQTLVRCFDLLALAGLLAGIALSVRLWFGDRRANPLVLASVFFSGLCLFLFSLDDWMHVYDYGRIASPMAAYLLIQCPAGWPLLVPSALMTCRVAVQVAPQIFHAAGLGS